MRVAWNRAFEYNFQAFPGGMRHARLFLRKALEILIRLKPLFPFALHFYSFTCEASLNLQTTRPDSPPHGPGLYYPLGPER